MKLPSLASIVATIVSWGRQPTTIAGLMAAAGAVASYVTGHRDAAIVALSGGLVGLVLPDNSAARPTAQRLVVDLLDAAATHNLAASAPAVLADARALADQLIATPPAQGATK